MTSVIATVTGIRRHHREMPALQITKNVIVPLEIKSHRFPITTSDGQRWIGRSERIQSLALPTYPSLILKERKVTPA
jgi:hypothetical protein